MSEIFYSREFPFGSLLFLITSPVNAVFLIGMLLAVEPTNYYAVLDFIPIEFYMFNFAITVCGMFLVWRYNEWSDGGMI